MPTDQLQEAVEAFRSDVFHRTGDRLNATVVRSGLKAALPLLEQAIRNEERVKVLGEVQKLRERLEDDQRKWRNTAEEARGKEPIHAHERFTIRVAMIGQFIADLDALATLDKEEEAPVAEHTRESCACGHARNTHRDEVPYPCRGCDCDCFHVPDCTQQVVEEGETAHNCFDCGHPVSQHSGQREGIGCSLCDCKRWFVVTPATADPAPQGVSGDGEEAPTVLVTLTADEAQAILDPKRYMDTVRGGRQQELADAAKTRIKAALEVAPPFDPAEFEREKATILRWLEQFDPAANQDQSTDTAHLEQAHPIKGNDATKGGPQYPVPDYRPSTDTVPSGGAEEPDCSCDGVPHHADCARMQHRDYPPVTLTGAERRTLDDLIEAVRQERDSRLTKEQLFERLMTREVADAVKTWLPSGVFLDTADVLRAVHEGFKVALRDNQPSKGGDAQ